MSLQIAKTVTTGVFELDGGCWEVENNVWILGDTQSCIIIDAPHDADRIAAEVGDRAVRAIILTHAHSDHIDAALELRELTDAPILLHPDDEALWELTLPTAQVDGYLADGDIFYLGGSEIQVLHTPGHTPGSICLLVPDLGVVFAGDTLFNGGPGATGRSYSHYPTIVKSIRSKLFVLNPETVVHTGHGPDTTIAAELANVPDKKRD